MESASAPTRGPQTATSPAAPKGVVAVAPETSATPDGIRVGFGSVWVVNHPVGNIDRIDPRTNRTQVITISRQACFIPWIGAGRVWVGACSYSDTTDPGTTWVIDPSSDKIVHTVPAYAIGAAFLGNSVWLENQTYSRILRFDAHTYRPTGSVPVAGLPVAGDGYLWVVGEVVPSGIDLHYIDKIDPRTDRVVHRFTTPDIGRSGRAIVADGALWEVGLDTGSLLRLDTTSGRIQIFHLRGDASLAGNYEIFPLAAAGSIWVRISDDRIDRIDPGTGAVTATYPADPQSGGMLAYGFGDLWVANVQAGTVWREPVSPAH